MDHPHDNARRARSDTPAIDHLTEDVLTLDRAGAMPLTAATLIAVTGRSLADRPPDPQVGAPPAEAISEWRGIQDSGRLDYPTPTPNKQFATLAAKAAMRGITLQRLAGGGYLLTRWNLCKELPDLAGAEALLAGMGVIL